MLRAAARRFLLLTFGLAGMTALISMAIGALTGSAIDRAVSLGLYIIGSLLLVGGFFMGNRGPLRPKGDSAVALPLFGRRGVRRATPAEREEAINTSAVFVSVGFVLILLAVVADSRFDLF
jgi:hypothetical protein